MLDQTALDSSASLAYKSRWLIMQKVSSPEAGFYLAPCGRVYGERQGHGSPAWDLLPCAEKLPGHFKVEVGYAAHRSQISAQEAPGYPLALLPAPLPRTVCQVSFE